MTDAASQIRVILNGDDFGYSPGVNSGIITALDYGILTSTSVMVKRKAAHEAKQLVAYKDVSVGLHLDMTEGGPHAIVDLVQLFAMSAGEIERSFQSQIEAFVKITGQLPHHIDGHHNVHLHPRIKPFVLAFSRQHAIPVRSVSSPTFVTSFCGTSPLRWNNPKKVTAASLISILAALKPGTHEIMCHPGYLDYILSKSDATYKSQRALETQALTSPEVKAYVTSRTDISLINWRDVKPDFQTV